MGRLVSSISGHRGLNHIKICAKSIVDGLRYDLFKLDNEPIIQPAYFLKFFKYNEVVGYKKTRSELRIEALNKLMEIQAGEDGKKFTYFQIVEVSDVFDSVVGTSSADSVVWCDGKWY